MPSIIQRIFKMRSANITGKYWLGEIRKKYSNAVSAGLYMKSVGTRERCNVENVSIIIRSVCKSMPEDLIGLPDLHQLDAEYMCAEILRHLSHSSFSKVIVLLTLIG